MNRKILLAVLLCALTSATFAQWPAVTKQTRPWTRWWWMGSAVDEPNISRLLKEYRKAGFGGVEVTPIYGAIGYEKRYIDFLSPKWVNVLRYSSKTATALGLGLDINTGTGWPFGGPQITPEFAASKLRTRVFDLKGDVRLTVPIVSDSSGIKGYDPKLQGVIAYGDKGQVINLTNNIGPDGRINWSLPVGKYPGVTIMGEELSGANGLKPGNYLVPKFDADGKAAYELQPGKWQIVAIFLDKTGQVVKRSAPGGAGFTMDHLSKNALQTYLKRFDVALGSVPPGIRCYFNDSYEVYNADLSPGLFAEFIKRRGYDAREHIRELVGKEKNETVARIRTDYRETMSDMILENFTQPWTKWIHGKKALSRNQAHGSPGNMLDLYGAVDIPETETFGLTRFPIPGLNFYTNDTRNVPPDPLMLKFASSGAHVTGKPLASSETFTWLGEHFKVPLSHAKAEVEQVFLSGVNHVFYHGTAYSPADVAWPGWLFYASVEFSPQNSLWPHLNGLNEYITRCQSVLQSGRADNELLIYWPMFDAWNDAPAKLDFQLSVHSVDQWLQPTDFYKTSKGLMDAGYSVDFISDRQVAASKTAGGAILPAATASPYKTLIIPSCKFIPLETVQNALKLAAQGATVIFQKLPDDVPGFHDFEARRAQLSELLKTLSFKDVAEGVKEARTGKGAVVFAKDVAKALSYKSIFREELVDGGLQFIRRKATGATWYFLVNHTAKTIEKEISLNASGKVTFFDPLTGVYGAAKSTSASGKTRVTVQLISGQSLIIKVGATTPATAWKYALPQEQLIALKGPFALSFTGGGPVLPKSQELSKPVSWTDLQDPDAKRFSGTAVYTTSFTLPAKTTREYVLDLGDVRESAHVWVNGQDAGILWSVPYRANIGKYLKTGANTLRIEVVNLMANRIRDLDRKKIQWRNYNEINFVNLFYQPFDAANWEDQPSGLLGPIAISTTKN